MAGELILSIEDALTVFLNEQPTPLFELDTMESLKLRVAAQARDEAKQPRPILPDLILLEEKVETDTEETKIPIKTTAGCRAIHIKNPQVERINPLGRRHFRVLDFGILARLRIEAAGLDRKKQRQYADELVELFDLPDIQSDPETYVKYAIYFGFGGMDRFETRISPATRTGFIDAIQTSFGLKNFDIIRLHWDNWADEIGTQLGAVQAAVRKDLALFNAYRERLAPYETITSKLQLDRTHLSVKFTIATDLYELFNGLVLSPAVPFTAVGDFFKVLKTFKPPKSWAVRCPPKEQVATEKASAFARYCQTLAEDLPTGNEIMIMYVLNRLAEPERNKIKPDPRNYSAVFIVPGAQDEKTHETAVEMHIQSRIDDELREEKLLGRIFEAFPFPVTKCTYEQKNVEADFLAPSPGNLDIPLFYDMVLTDPLISQIMLIQESTRTFRERGGIFAYFRYNTHVSNKEFLTCRINSGVVEAKDQSRAPEVFKTLGKKLIRVKLMNCRNQAEAERFRDIITQILSMYYS